MSTPASILKQYWGYDSFRPMQEDIVRSVLEGRPTLALLPTGGGKSICFQVPALLMDGICIVVSPLIALMKDQVEQLKKRGIKAAAVYSGMSKKEIDVILDNCIYGGLKFIYVSPERIQTELFMERARQMQICLLAVDEAHCISQWGYDFRPPYLQIGDFIAELGLDRVIALTASATREVKEDIIEKLGLGDPVVFQKSFARTNLSYSVFNLENKEQKLLEILQNVPGSSVIYVRSRKQTREVAAFLSTHQIPADFYHAGLSGQVRVRKQDAWISSQTRVMVATNAFGMGIDKPDVRTVVHLDLPESLEAYYQEAGRAGRDEKKAYAVLLYTGQDVARLEQRADRSMVTVEFIRRVYQALANYYKLAVGSSALSSFEFDYPVFVETFKLPTVETYHALSKLADEGLIQLTESFREPSRIIFLLPQEEVYRYQVASKSMDPIIKVLLRLYGGELFSDYMTIREKDVAQLLKEPVDVAIRQLKYLHDSGVIDYLHASEKPRITFLTHRYDANDLPVDKQRIAWRNAVTKQKVASVKAYAESTLKCRSRILQNYFDEVSYQDCRVCDVCLARNRRAQEAPSEDLLEYIASGPKDERQLQEAFPKVSEEDLVMALRVLMDRKKITLSADERFILAANLDTGI